MARCWGFSPKNLQRCRREGQWLLYCGDHRRQWLVVVSFIVFTVLGGTASILGLFQSRSSDLEAIRAEVVHNLRVLAEKITVADKAYRWLREREALEEKAHPTVFLPSPYKDLGQRLRRDLPQFRAQFSAAFIAEKWGGREPFNTYARIYKTFEGVEAKERQAVGYFQTAWETWEDIGVVGMKGRIKAFGAALSNLLRLYLLSFTAAHQDAGKQGLVHLAQLPQGLYIVKELEDEKAKTKEHGSGG